MTDPGETLVMAMVIYLIIAVACALGLIVRWAEKSKGDAVIWPVTGFLWPALAVIGLWKVWKGDRHD